MAVLEDAFGRRFKYLRLSITDACNFKCTYCLPEGYHKPQSGPTDLSVQEIHNLVVAFAELGTEKVRITGGEPTLRRDFLEISAAIAGVPGVREVALSTNGNRLSSYLKNLGPAGIHALNISIDSLDPVKFQKITGMDRLPEILEGIDEALKFKDLKIKVNAVWLGGELATDLEMFLDWIRVKPVTVRFIELMRTGKNASLFDQCHVRADTLADTLLTQGWTKRSRGPLDGPATEFTHPSYLGAVGIIAPYSKDFCATCNRLRITSQGGFRLCLFGEGNHSIRHLLKSPLQKEALQKEVCSLLLKKEVSHYLPEGRYGNNQGFSAMGG